MLKRIPNRSQLGEANPGTSSTPTVAANREPQSQPAATHCITQFWYFICSRQYSSEAILANTCCELFYPPLMLYLGVIRDAVDLNAAGPRSPNRRCHSAGLGLSGWGGENWSAAVPAMQPIRQRTARLPYMAVRLHRAIGPRTVLDREQVAVPDNEIKWRRAQSAKVRESI